ncbi:MAG: hypothetical protein WC825_08305 [Gallionellaceae bacterium]
MNIYMIIGLGMMLGAAWFDTTFAWKSKFFMYANAAGVCLFMCSFFIRGDVA